MRKLPIPGPEWWLLGLAIADWVALRRGVAPNPPSVLAVLVALAGVAFLYRLIRSVMEIRRKERRWIAIGQAILSLGIVVSLAAGMANWLLGLQGLVILHEGETARMVGGTDLQVFEAGPLARFEEMGLTLALDEVELVAEEGETFSPRSRLRFWQRANDAVRLVVAPLEGATAGNLRFFQGAFGFAPHIVILDGETTLFDRVVPFLSKRHGQHGVSFDGRFSVAEADLTVDGAISLDSLDEDMRGHASLVLVVYRGGETLGRGELEMGHFAELEEEIRVGFVGLKRWSEIDIVRRNYGSVVLIGGVLMIVGAMVSMLGLWRGR